MSPQLKMGGSSISLPRSRIARIAIGALLILGGVLGFLPILGFWMIPLGLLVLSIDLPRVRRWRRKLVVWWERRRRGGNDVPGSGNPSGNEREPGGPYG